MNSKYAVIAVMLALGFAIHYASADSSIPTWVKNNAKYWKEGQIGDDEFVKGMQYLIENKIMQVPDSTQTVEKSSQIPSWVKNNAGWWADGSLNDGEFISGMQYLIGAGIIDISNSAQPSIVQTSTSASMAPTTDGDLAKCDSATTAADKQSCISDIEASNQLNAKIAMATPYVVGPVTYYIIGSDLIDTGDGGVFINIHTILENTGSQSSNPDLFCTGPFACNYHLSDGQSDYPPSIFSLTSGHLELRYQKPVAIDWNFYSKQNIGGFNFDPSKQYSLKISEPFGSTTIPLKFVKQ